MADERNLEALRRGNTFRPKRAEATIIQSPMGSHAARRKDSPRTPSKEQVDPDKIELGINAPPPQKRQNAQNTMEVSESACAIGVHKSATVPEMLDKD